MNDLGAPRRVLHVLPQLSRGGAERVAVEVANALHDRFEPWFCILGSKPETLPGFACRGTVMFLSYNGSLRDWSGLIRCFRLLRSVIRESHPHIVHAHLWPAAGISAAATRGTGAAHVTHVHDMQPWLESARMRYCGERWAQRRYLQQASSQFIAVSQCVAAHAAKHLPWDEHRITVIENGIDVSAYQPVARSAPDGARPIVIGVVGRVTEDKGIDTLISAAAALARMGVNFEIEVAGDDKHAPRFKQMAREQSVADRIHFIGEIDAMRQFYERIDIFALPSRSEGMPMSVLEAMAMGLPCIVSAVGGVPKIIRNDDEGVLVPPNDPAKLCEALHRLCTSRDLRQQIGQQARNRVCDGFTLTSAASRIAEVYERSLRVRQ